MKNIKILDCTLRDGGYYNNWNFSKEVALEMCDLSEAELDKALDPARMTKGGFVE